MAAERLAPDAILSQTNLSGSVTAIQDDPDSPDTSWLTCPDNTSNTAVHVSFPTPSAALTGSQNARVLVRPTSAGTNAGTASVDVLVAGVVVTSSATSTISAQQVLSATFDASLITDATALEVRLNGTSAGGKATSRKSIEVGAIEVNAEVAASIPAISGSGAVTFGFQTAGSGTVDLPSIQGSGGVAFGFSTSGAGTYTAPATPEVTGSGGVSFGFATAGTGTYVPPAITGSGGVEFGFASSGTGTVSAPGAIAGSGGVAFGFSTAGTGSYTDPVIAAVTGSGGVAFGFSTAGIGAFTAPAPEPDAGEGPWITHGVIHLAKPPQNH